MIKHSVFGLAVITALIGTPALAADMPLKAPPPPAPIYSWTGWYVGLNAGGAWTKTDVTANADPTGWLFETPFINASGSRTINGSSFIGGVQAGYNWQNGNYVVGFEADADWLNANGTSFITQPVPANVCHCVGGSMTQSAGETFFATARPRVGLVFDRTLVFATGGVAIAQVNSADSHTGVPPVTQSTSTSTTRMGWTVGGGLEYALWTNFSLKAEYLYADLGSWTDTTPSFPCCAGTSINFSHHLTESIARVGLNYRFH